MKVTESVLVLLEMSMVMVSPILFLEQQITMQMVLTPAVPMSFLEPIQSHLQPIGHLEIILTTLL